MNWYSNGIRKYSYFNFYLFCINFIHIWSKIVFRLFLMTCSAIYGQKFELRKHKNDVLWLGCIKMIDRTVFIYNLKNIFSQFIAGALSRALSLQETIDKHSKIQALAGLICTMIESCPSTQSQQQTLPLYRQLQVSFAPIFEFPFLFLERFDEKMQSNGKLDVVICVSSSFQQQMALGSRSFRF